MRTILVLAAGGLVGALVCSIAPSGELLTRTGRSGSASPPESTAVQQHVAQAAGSVDGAQLRLRGEIASLRREVKDLLEQAQVSAAVHAAALAADTAPPSPVAEQRDLLDARLSEGQRSTLPAVGVEALEQAVASPAASARGASLTCQGRLCRIVMSALPREGLNPLIEQLTAAPGKAMGAAIVLEEGDEVNVYFSDDSAALTVEAVAVAEPSARTVLLAAGSVDDDGVTELNNDSN